MIQTQFMDDSIHKTESIRCALSQNETKLLRDDMESTNLYIDAGVCVRKTIWLEWISVSRRINFTCTENFISRGNVFDAIQIKWRAKDGFKLTEWALSFDQIHLIHYDSFEYFGSVCFVRSLFLYSIDRNAIDLFFDAKRNVQTKFLISLPCVISEEIRSDHHASNSIRQENTIVCVRHNVCSHKRVT